MPIGIAGWGFPPTGSVEDFKETYNAMWEWVFKSESITKYCKKAPPSLNAQMVEATNKPKIHD